ncbi:MAG: NUDIX hydrolase [Alphaproteobacteria bacterium]
MEPPKTLRPLDAASLVLYRRRNRGPEVLMGQRHAGHVFMPHRFVFPGGRVDPRDARVAAASALPPAAEAKLALGCRSPARVHALAIAAVRETYEETGLMIGVPSPFAGRLDERHWQGFREAGIAPALDRLRYIFRAVTPPGMVRRYDARFFLAEADGTLHGALGGDGELENMAWLAIEEALALDLSLPTRLVLEEVPRLIGTDPSADAGRPVPFLFTRRGRDILKAE